MHLNSLTNEELIRHAEATATTDLERELCQRLEAAHYALVEWEEQAEALPAICENCESWGGEHRGDHRQCSSPHVLEGYQYFGKEDSWPWDGIVVENDEGWAMFCGPGFGCVNFISKKEQETE